MAGADVADGRNGMNARNNSSATARMAMLGIIRLPEK
jgi:hypothetical protein